MTGNYHAETARVYSDVGLLTCDETLGQDVTELSPPVSWHGATTGP